MPSRPSSRGTRVTLCRLCRTCARPFPEQDLTRGRCAQHANRIRKRQEQTQTQQHRHQDTRLRHLAESPSNRTSPRRRLHPTPPRQLQRPTRSPPPNTDRARRTTLRPREPRHPLPPPPLRSRTRFFETHVAPPPPRFSRKKLGRAVDRMRTRRECGGLSVRSPATRPGRRRAGRR